MPITVGHDSSNTRNTLTVGDQTVAYYSIPAAEAAGLGDFGRLPASLKVVLENMLRFEDGKTVSVDDIKRYASGLCENGQLAVALYGPAEKAPTLASLKERLAA